MCFNNIEVFSFVVVRKVSRERVVQGFNLRSNEKAQSTWAYSTVDVTKGLLFP